MGRTHRSCTPITLTNWLLLLAMNARYRDRTDLGKLKPLAILQSRSNLYTDQNYIKAVFLLDIVLMMYDLQQVDLEMWAICENKASSSFKFLTFSKDRTWQTMVTPRRAKVV